MNHRNNLLFLTAIFLPLSSAIGVIFLFIWALNQISPEVFEARYSSGLEILVGISIFVVVFVVGYLIGLLMLIIIWRPHVSRSVLENIFTKPYIPVISDTLTWVFSRLYPIDK